MDIYLFYPKTYEALYNCTSYTIEQVPLEERRHLLIGSSFLILFFVFETLYVPCLFAIYKNINQPCYAIMFFMGITDVTVLFAVGFLTGYFSIVGAVFCSYPNFNYVVGCFCTVFWSIETCCAVLLALNRCLSLWRPSVCALIFSKSRTWILLAIVLAYSLFYGLFHMPAVYNSIRVAWMFNPHYGYYNDVGDTYQNPMEAAHDCFIFFAICGLYFTFILLLFLKRAKCPSDKIIDANPSFVKSTMYVSNETNKTNVVQKTVFIQALLICSANACTAALFFCMALFDMSNYILYVSTYVWCMAHGIPSVIYIFLNKTIRRRCLEMLIGKTRLAKHSRASPKTQIPINSTQHHTFRHRTLTQ